MNSSSRQARRQRRLRFESLEERRLLTSTLQAADDHGAPAVTAAAWWATSQVSPFVAPSQDGPEGESGSTTPHIVAPANGSVETSTVVTLRWDPIPQYNGLYLLRLNDLHWNGVQASGFKHDSSLYYVSIATYKTSVTVPVKPGADYSWWVHQPAYPAETARFSVSPDAIAPAPTVPADSPTLLSPENGSEVTAAKVTLTFAPIPGYSGSYLVRLHDQNWDGRQASGFTHDSTAHYLSIATTQTSITVPVKPGASYRWWVHKPYGTAAAAAFTVAGDVAPAPTPQTSSSPAIVAPLEGDILHSASVTLRFQPMSGYTGKYLVRLHDLNWDGRQASGFTHDSTAHYLSIATTQTSITVPVKPGASYRWWVHTPDGTADRASFSVADDVVPTPVPQPATAPQIVSPEEGDEITTNTVTLRFEPVAGYTGSYLVRLHDLQWNGVQAAGFVHDSNLHYLSIATRQTSITLPVRSGATYKWWVHIPGKTADTATFTTAVNSGPQLPEPPANEILDPVFVDGRYRATVLAQWAGKNVDISSALQHCIDRTPAGATLEIPAGRYLLGHQVKINHAITLTTVGMNIGDPPASRTSGAFAELVAAPALNEPDGMLYISALDAMHHIIINGNKSAREGTPAFNTVSNGTNNRYGFNATIDTDNFVLSGNVFTEALGGTGLLIRPGHRGAVIRDNEFSRNGIHNRRNLWSDGLTVLELRDSQIIDNRFIDNTDIDLILGGGANLVVQRNTIVHTGAPGYGAFAGLMIQKWPNTSGDYTGADISYNVIDGGPNRSIGSGIYLGSEGWYDETPFGSTIPGQVGASVHDNTVRNVQNGIYIAARGFSVYGNSYSNAHGGLIPTSNGPVNSLAPIIVSPTASVIDFRGENINPATSGMFASVSWRGRILNWPF